MPSDSQLPAAGDEDVALRAQQGCADAFEELVRRYQVPLVRFLRRLGNGAEAEDLTQDTFVRAYENMHRYRSKWPLGTWLFTIARRVSLNHRRRRRPAADTDALKSARSEAASPVEAVAVEEDRRRLWEQAAEVLSETQLTALWLYYVEQLPVKEVARVLGRTQTAVKTTMFRARKRLLPLLDPPEGAAAGGCRPSAKTTCGCPTAAEVSRG